MEREQDFRFKNKCVFILSPVGWGKMRVSKHHYAIELAKRGNQVFFFEPPNLNLPENIVTQKDTEEPNLTIVSYRPVYRGERFLPKIIFNQLFKIQISHFRKYFKRTPDVVICFDVNRFPNLKWFKAEKTIMFLSDLFRPGKLPPVVASADICFALSDTIIQELKKYNAKGIFINHGINDAFRSIAAKNLAQLSDTSKKITDRIKVGYMGSLFMEAIDRPIMQKTIEENPLVDFVFWGQYKTNEDNLIAYQDESIFQFIEFLKKQPNVELRGAKISHDLIHEIQEMDMFWICYYMHKTWIWDGSNSHKLLEYLSTGKPVVAHHVSSYSDNDLLYMLSDKDNANFPELFSKVLNTIINGEDTERIKKRLEFALANTYENQVTYIESKINSLSKN